MAANKSLKPTPTARLFTHRQGGCRGSGTAGVCGARLSSNVMRQRPTQTERANSAAREQSWAWIYGLLHEHHGLAVASLARTSPHGSSRTSRPAPASARARETTIARVRTRWFVSAWQRHERRTIGLGRRRDSQRTAPASATAHRRRWPHSQRSPARAAASRLTKQRTPVTDSGWLWRRALCRAGGGA